MRGYTFLKNYRVDGFSYIEVMVSISLVIVLAFVIDVLLIDRVLQTKTGSIALGHQIAQEEIEVLRNYPFELLSTTTDGVFIGILPHRGTISVASSSSAFSGENIVDIQSATTTATTTGQLVFPKNAYADATLTAQLRFFSDSFSPFGGGIFFRALDDNNGYLLKLASSNDLTLDVIEDGTVTNLLSQLYTVTVDTWYHLELILNGNSITLNINGLPVFSINDDTYNEGYASIVATDGAHIGIDDIVINDGSTETWNFDKEPAGALAGEWLRPGISDLPSSATKLTIKNYLGSDRIKEVTARVEWQDNTTTTAAEQTTCRSR